MAIRFPELLDCFIGIAGVFDLSEEGMQFDDPAVRLDYVAQSAIEVSPTAMMSASCTIPTQHIASVPIYKFT